MSEVQQLIREHAQLVEQQWRPFDPAALREGIASISVTETGVQDGPRLLAPPTPAGDRARRTRGVLVAIAAVVLAVVLVASYAVLHGGDPQGVTDTGPVEVGRYGGWASAPSMRLGGSALSGVDRPMTWTGEEFVLPGALASSRDGAARFGESLAYRPETASWRRISAPPVDLTDVAQVAWTGTELFVVGRGLTDVDRDGTRIEGAAYDPFADHWRTITPSPSGFAPAGPAGVSFGTPLMVDGSIGHIHVDTAVLVIWSPGNGVVTYDVETDSWDTSAAGGGPGHGPDPTDDVVATMADGQFYVASPDGSQVARFDPTARTWATVPALPSPVTDLVGISNREVAFDRASGQVAVLDSGGTVWKVGSSIPHVGEDRAVAVSSGRLVVWGGTEGSHRDGFAYDPLHDTWTPLPDLPPGVAAAITSGEAGTPLRPSDDPPTLLFGVGCDCDHDGRARSMVAVTMDQRAVRYAGVADDPVRADSPPVVATPTTTADPATTTTGPLAGPDGAGFCAAGGGTGWEASDGWIPPEDPTPDAALRRALENDALNAAVPLDGYSYSVATGDPRFLHHAKDGSVDAIYYLRLLDDGNWTIYSAWSCG